MPSLRDSGKIVGPAGTLVSVKQLARQCSLPFPLSLRLFIDTPACQTTKLDFRPNIDGFAFNNQWVFEQAEKDAIWATFDVSALAVATAMPLLLALLAPLPPPGDLIALEGLLATAKKAIDTTLSKNYGLCGGMAYAALDYYKANLVIERGFAPSMPGASDSTPTHATLQGGKLRDYIWKRLMDSMISGGAALRTIGWMILLNGLSRADLLLEYTRNEEWVKVKQKIASGTPWPICLIGTTGSPFENHQVLAYGYTDTGNSKGTLFIYDNRFPDEEHTIDLDFTRKDHLEAHESAKNDKRGPLRGFFCTDYQPVSPPVAVGLLKNINAAEAHNGQTVSVSFTATNAGFGPTPPLQLYVSALRSTMTTIGDELVSSGEGSASVLSSDEISGMALPAVAEAEGTLSEVVGAQMQQPGNPGPGPGPTPKHHYSWQTFSFVPPHEPNASIASLFNDVVPHGPAPTNTVSRSLDSPITVSAPKDTPTTKVSWSFSAGAILTSSLDGTTIISKKTLPFGLVKEGKEGKEKEKEKEKEKSKEVSKDNKDSKEALTEKISKETDDVQSLSGMTNPNASELPEEGHGSEEAFIRPEERPAVGAQTLHEASERQLRSAK